MRPPHAHPLVALLFVGCIVPVSFDPVGASASMEGSWTIDGAPPTEASCEAVEVRYVRIRFFRDEVHRDHADLAFECADGSFDTRPVLLVGAGEWTIAPLAIRADGSEVARGALQTVDTLAEGGNHIVVDPFDIGGGSG